MPDWRAPSVCIVGVGGIGGWLASLLDQAGWEVRLLARGGTLQALRERGLRVSAGEGPARVLRLPASDDAGELGCADYLILALKGHDLVAAAPSLAPLVGARTAIVPAMNGLQWWFTQGMAAPAAEAPLRSVDPDGLLRSQWPAARVIGCVIHATAAATAPGEVKVLSADNLIIGESSGEQTSRVTALADACSRAGVRTIITSDIRLEIWRKLWGNMSMNPLSALTRASTGRLLDDPLTRELVRTMMSEMAAAGERIGLSMGMAPEERMAVTRRLGDFRTSMERDVEAGRALEVEGLLGAVVELAGRVGAPAPTLSAVYGLTRQLDRSLGR